ncbi:MAG: hypothetical protein DSM107014_13160 [Gomphosphaeria aponina SAG 52.96 = DSM 107014]|uniref:Uncharacterized protein n=1 Tax=Gomphosphaeria aponina SAG 52.96 = DSM 107014 TaxID=1521640 RepID=A0A941GS41_9CHRO|nr:hypothetical protein [Gomphosphaeria aponina SAG 52.96 = DSM 107014]
MKIMLIDPEEKGKNLVESWEQEHEVIVVDTRNNPHKFILKHQPDLVYVNSISAVEWVVASRECGVKNTLHCTERKEEYLRLLLLGKVRVELMDNVDTLLCASLEVKQDVEEFFLTLPPICEVVEDELTHDKMLEKAKLIQTLPKNAFGEIIDEEKPIIGAKSGWEIFVETAKKLPQLQFLWLGELGSGEKLSNLFSTGKVESYDFYLGLADLLVVCEKGEKLVEKALILGKQVVCFSQAGDCRFVLDKYGYVITGEANVELLVGFIQRLFPEEEKGIFVPQWLGKVQAEFIRKHDKFSLVAL